MKDLLSAHGFTVTRDQTLPTLARSLSERAWRATRGINHLRIVVAEPAAGGR